jgi:hypothetical protein
MNVLRTVARVLAMLVLLQVLTWNQSQAKPCSDQTQILHGPLILSVSTYYPRPGKEDAVYQGLVQKDQQLKKLGLEGFTVLRNPGGVGPAVEWQMTFATFAAHDAWYKQSIKVFPDNDPFDNLVLRVDHIHYKFVDGWTYVACP